jgi:hypothetical protein
MANLHVSWAEILGKVYVAMERFIHSSGHYPKAGCEQVAYSMSQIPSVYKEALFANEAHNHVQRRRERLRRIISGARL